MKFLDNLSIHEPNKNQLQDIEIDRIIPDPEQPRKNFDNLEELAITIQNHGLQNPIHVKKEGDRFIIITGERRWRACKEFTALKILPCIIHEHSEQKTIKYLQLIENLQRQDLNLLEEAYAFQELLKDKGCKQIDLAAELGISAIAINKSLKLLKLNENIQKDLAHYPGVPKSLLVEIAGEPEAKQQELWDCYKSGKLSKREQVRKKRSDDKPKSTIADKEAEEIWKKVKKAVKKDPAVIPRIINTSKISTLPGEILWPLVEIAVKQDRKMVKKLLNKNEIKKLLGKKE